MGFVTCMVRRRHQLRGSARRVGDSRRPRRRNSGTRDGVAAAAAAQTGATSTVGWATIAATADASFPGLFSRRVALLAIAVLNEVPIARVEGAASVRTAAFLASRPRITQYGAAVTQYSGLQAVRVPLRFRPVCQPEAGQRHACQAEAEFPERLPARDRLGQAFGEFIEFVVHTFPFVGWLLLFVVVFYRITSSCVWICVALFPSTADESAFKVVSVGVARADFGEL